MQCRVCLNDSHFLLSIYGDHNDEVIASTLRKHFEGVFDPLPRDGEMICEDCWLRVKEFHQFYCSVEQTQAMYTLGLVDEKPHDNSLEFFSDEHVSVEIKEEQVEASVECETTDLEAPLFEPEHIEVDQIAVGEEGVVESVAPELDVEPTVIGEDCLETPPDEPATANAGKRRRSARSTVERKATTTKLKTKTTKKLANQKKTPRKVLITTDANGKPRIRRIKPIAANDEEIIRKYIAMNCELCAATTENFTEMQEHFRVAHGDSKPYVICCGRKLSKHILLAQHAHKHEDPDFFKCSDCNKSFADDYTLRYHVLTNHSSDDKLTFNCDECGKRFPRLYLLEKHKAYHIPESERKFRCDKCPNGKPFASAIHLSHHISMRHKKAPNVCHVCAKEIRDNQSYEKHVRLHFEDSGPRVKCPKPGCDSWLKDAENLKHHLRHHNDEGKVYKCEECGKLCKNYRALSGHQRYTHSKEVFTCEECNKTFKKAISLKEHMAQHTGESLYQCPFCTRTFNSNANMHSHKKRMHPVEWEEWRKTKRGSSQKIISRQPAPSESFEEFAAVESSSVV